MSDKSAWPARSKADDGFTLVELLVSMTMAVVIVAGAAAMLIYAVQRQSDLTQRADQVGEGQIQMEKMVRGIRQGVIGTATVTTTSSSSKLKLETYVDGNCGTTAVTVSTKCLVVYECASEICARTTGSSTTKTEKMLTGVKNASTVFEGITGPSPCGSSTAEVVSFVEVKLELKSKKGGVTKLQNGGGLRSCS
jgi:prepilin-type N-terminal cleavage/methylation domain-containing protein